MTAFEAAWAEFQARPADQRTPDIAFVWAWNAAIDLAMARAQARLAPAPSRPVETDCMAWASCLACTRIAVPGFDYCSAHLTPGACDKA